MKLEIISAAVLCAVLTNAESDVVSKVVAGYQGWFTCPGSSDPVDGWVHWGKNDSVPTFELWPDTREYSDLYNWGESKLGNAQPAKLFASYDDQTIDTHFKWMNQYGIDAAAVQRFGTHVDGGVKQEHLDGIFAKSAAAAEKHGTKFFTGWDISGWTDYMTSLPSDWKDTIKKITNSPAYAKEDGKPVVTIWGVGVDGRPGNGEDALKVIKYLQQEGAFVIVGSSRQWRNLSEDFLKAFAQADMVQPWNVGAFNTTDDIAANKASQQADADWCKENNVIYQPVVYPGFSWKNLKGGPKNQIPRQNGKFMWQQFVNMRELSLSSAMVAMFDEYDEGTAIAKAAENSSMAPYNHYFLTLDADGESLSSDFYLRVTKDGGDMIKCDSPLVQDCPTKYRL